ncbi:hypothetical protein O6H91_03G034800 [Diphasiastrum complanatum]|uniref:Uncharacterized protein n=2 Tax=Diphasiastrum complanatum TaxID=34168 RepID=A0ACC2E5D5_DIPCM|nr:hypothetical protein O6H91_03G014600 [Diphasiastrum complanatum]KAJ7561592.1 hypothetical protein O6H91_03G034800 [Diphasiastrum complanatum]
MAGTPVADPPFGELLCALDAHHMAAVEWEQEPEELDDEEIEAALRAALVSRFQPETSSSDLGEGTDCTADSKSHLLAKGLGFITEEVILHESFLSALRSVVQDPQVQHAFLANPEIWQNFRQRGQCSPFADQSSQTSFFEEITQRKVSNLKPLSNSGHEIKTRIHIKDWEFTSQMNLQDQQPIVSIVLLAMATLLVTSLAKNFMF